jgi:Uma2 family endonuclease
MTEVTPIEIFEGVRPHHIEFEEYLAMVSAGVFGDANVELVDGELIELAPSQTQNSRMLGKVFALLHTAYSAMGFELYIDAIAKIGPKSGRAPDISVVNRDIGDRNTLLPDDILLAVEISDSTLAEDLGRKRLNYAQAGIRHYWVVDVGGERVHRFSEPAGGDYGKTVEASFTEPLPLPGCDTSIVVG